MSSRWWKIMFLRSKVRPARKTDNFAAICEPIVGILNISDLYRPPRPVTGIALPFLSLFTGIQFLATVHIGLTTAPLNRQHTSNGNWGFLTLNISPADSNLEMVTKLLMCALYKVFHFRIGLSKRVSFLQLTFPTDRWTFYIRKVCNSLNY
jgi:hypothetical protein